MSVRVISCPAGSALVDFRNAGEHIHKWWKIGKFYEPELLNYIQAHYSGGTFIDVGACIGNHTLFFAKFCDCRVLAIEPVPRLIEWAKHNVGLNGLSHRVIFENCAASDHEGWGKMDNVSPEGIFNIGMNNLTETPGPTKLRLLDDLVKEHDLTDVKLVKLDAEWHDLHVLRGANNLLTYQHPALFIETPREDYRDQITVYLGDFGYKRLPKRFNPTPMYEFVWRGK